MLSPTIKFFLFIVCVSFVDHQLGKLLDALDNSPYKDNTYIGMARS